MVAVIFLIAILASLGVALVALFRRGDHSQTLLRALTVRVGQTWVESPVGWRLAGIQFSSLGGA